MAQQGHVVNRHEQLLDAAVDQLLAAGLEGMTIRRVAQAAGVAHNTITHHFGSRHELLAAVFARLAERARQPGTGNLEAATPSGLRQIWAQLTAPSHAGVWPAFFEVFTAALRNPDDHAAFLRHATDDWVEPLAVDFAVAGMPRVLARQRATLLVAAVRGLVMQQLAGADRGEVLGALDELGSVMAGWLDPTSGRISPQGDTGQG